MNLSQSLIKEFNSYKISCAFPENEDKVCGLQFKAKYIDGLRTETTDAQRMGLYFEQQILGSSAHDHEILEPEKTKTGLLTADYKRIAAHVEVFKKNIEHHGFKIEQKQIYLETDKLGFKCNGTLDCMGVFQGGLFIGDPKYTGNFDDKWSDYGWKTSHIDEKEKILIQAIHYTWLVINVLKTRPRFFFFVHNSKNEIDSKIIEIVIDDERLNKHEQQLKYIHAELEMEIELNEWVAFPTVNGCAKCPVKECSHRITVPSIEQVFIS